VKKKYLTIRDTSCYEEVKRLSVLGGLVEGSGKRLHSIAFFWSFFYVRLLRRDAAFGLLHGFSRVGFERLSAGTPDGSGLARVSGLSGWRCSLAPTAR
jgi:hypothetical protein